MTTPPKISVIAACHVPGDGINRMIESLDRQTMPQEDFEVVIVDDGSPDDTFARLRAMQSTRPNLRVRQIPNSGWPSKPRNLALELATGEFVYIMDDDDTLYPDALRAAYDMAKRNRSDVLSPKHVRNNDIGWGMSHFEKNIDNLVGGKGIEGLLPMTPHKVYRREFLKEHGIRFPEGGRVLWEDIHFNVAAYRHAEVVSVLAETPSYLWHSTPGTISKSYGAAEEEHWRNLMHLFEFISTTLDDPAHEADRVAMILHQYRNRAVFRLGRAVPTASPEAIEMAMSYVKRIHDEYVPEILDEQLAPIDRARSVLLRAGRTDLLSELVKFDRTLGAGSQAAEVSWTDSGLLISATCTWLTKTKDGPAPLRPENGRILRNMPPEVAAALPRELVDVTDQLSAASAGLEIRARAEHETWALPGVSVPSFAVHEDGTGALRIDVRTEIDIEKSAFGRLPEAPIWDLYAHTGWLGVEKRSKLAFSERPSAALLNGRAVLTYPNKRNALTLSMRPKPASVLKHGGPRLTDAGGHADAFVLHLASVHVSGRTELACPVVLEPVARGGATLGRMVRASSGGPLRIDGRLVGNEQGARLEAGGGVPAGTYRLTVPVTGDAGVTAFVLDVKSDGVTVFRRVPAMAPAPALGTRVVRRARSIAGRMLRRLARTVRRR